MLECPELSGPAKTRLDLVEDQQRFVLAAPGRELPDVLDWGKIGPDSLIGFEHDSGDVSRLYSFAFQRGEEQIETGVFGPVTVGKGYLEDGRVLVDNPILLSGNASGLLGSE